MHTSHRLLLSAAVALCSAAAQANVAITEVAPWSSGNSAVGADWFELTNTGSTAINITGWTMDDDSASFANSVALAGITSIGAGQSVIFVETSNSATLNTFVQTWFNGTAPVGFAIGSYSGNKVGLSTSGDAVNIFNSAGALQASIAFGSSGNTDPLQTFDNAAGLSNTTVSQLSTVGINGAFLSANGLEIGSPGAIAAVPEPETYAMMLAGMCVLGAIARKRQR